MRKWFEKFWGVPSVQSTGKILAWTENAKLLEFVVGVVEDNLELADEASCKAWLLLEMLSVESPLMLEERFQVVDKGGWKALNA